MKARSSRDVQKSPREDKTRLFSGILMSCSFGAKVSFGTCLCAQGDRA